MSIFENLTPAPITELMWDKKYSRQERRHHAFVLKNMVNGKFIKREVVGRKITYSDVELPQATGFKWVSVTAIINDMLTLNPTLDLEPFMAYRDTKTRKICVK